jgi:hypothetical protein
MSLIGVKFTARNSLHFGFSISASALEGRSSQIPSEAGGGIHLDDILECFPNFRNSVSREIPTFMEAGGRLLSKRSKSVLGERRVDLGRERYLYGIFRVTASLRRYSEVGAP